mmetsp:Transcript_32113/g.94510  ORF Transcript_32113/g.94510 Transcript_32113/m.94510 type:complete len:207 (+) Transcript_32113:1261-1881(+)
MSSPSRPRRRRMPARSQQSKPRPLKRLHLGLSPGHRSQRPSLSRQHSRKPLLQNRRRRSDNSSQKRQRKRANHHLQLLNLPHRKSTKMQKRLRSPGLILKRRASRAVKRVGPPSQSRRRHQRRPPSQRQSHLQLLCPNQSPTNSRSLKPLPNLRLLRQYRHLRQNLYPHAQVAAAQKKLGVSCPSLRVPTMCWRFCVRGSLPLASS